MGKFPSREEKIAPARRNVSAISSGPCGVARLMQWWRRAMRLLFASLTVCLSRNAKNGKTRLGRETHIPHPGRRSSERPRLLLFGGRCITSTTGKELAEENASAAGSVPGGPSFAGLQAEG